MFTHADHPTWRSELAATLRLAVPLSLAGLLQMATHAIDVIFVARLGEEPLAATSLAIAIYGVIVWSLSGLTGSVAALIAAELGRRKHAVREVRRSTRMALWLAIASSAVGMVLCAQGEALMRLTGQSPAIAALADSYLDLLLWAMPCTILVNVLRTFVSALGRPVYATVITGLGVVVNGIGNYILIFGNFGAPALGLEGAAISTIFASVCGLAAYVVAIQQNRILRRYYIWGRFWRPEWTRFVEIVKIGTPVAVTVVAEAGFFSGAAFLMGRIGPAELAAHTLALNLASFTFQVPFAIGQAAAIRVGFHYGGRNIPAIGLAGWAAVAAGTGFMAIAATAMLLAPRPLLSIYVDVTDPANLEMVRFAVSYMVVAAAFQLVDGVQAVTMGALRGLQDTRLPMAYAVFGYWVPGLGCSLLLGFYTPMAGTGVWIGLAVGLAVVAALMLRRWMRRERLGLLPLIAA
ncbi:multidrug transporter [Erythrobacter sp. SG61-1L]|uniref:MATE family efflux transporter n=1 Tax=Erythrobacter sp. SG61-1L TaxID=1603897 RepID=UPI0006C9152F|nr:MATE family efflux transporter [Erythrobacter sp. SG61-1L]KPL68870.1 multidrug transporter [Erythrobacter sp. SG61-1L]